MCPPSTRRLWHLLNHGLCMSLPHCTPSSVDSAPQPEAWVVCLCAQWCGTCRAYQAVFDAVAAQFPQLHFVWLDVEEQEELVDDWDVETFPTVLLGRGAQVQFLGPVLPQPGVLQRLVENLCAAALPAQAVPEAGHALLQRVQGAAKS